MTKLKRDLAINSPNQLNLSIADVIIQNTSLAIILLGLFFLVYMSNSRASSNEKIDSHWFNQSTKIRAPLNSDVLQMFDADSSNSKPSKRSLSGKLTLSSIDSTQYFQLITEQFKTTESAQMLESIQQLPLIEFDFIQYKNRLLPSVRTVQRSDHIYWEWLVSPGKIWQSSKESKTNYMGFPFALQEKNANCTHNGYLIFSIDATNKVSSGYYQITSETCAYLQFDLAGRIEAKFEPDEIENKAVIIRDFQKETSHTKPVYSTKELAADYPNLSLSKLLPTDLNASTTSGLFIKGKHYQLNCETRYGRYLDCNQLALPSFSTAKSLFAGLALMRLEKEVPNIANTLVTQLIPECDVEQWKSVTLKNLLNMRSGNYLRKKYESDENSDRMVSFFVSESSNDKIKLACGMFPHRSKPGKIFVYHTSDTFLAGVMIERLYKKLTGLDDFYSHFLVNDLWRQLQLSPLLSDSKRTYDKQKQPFTGWGLTYLTDDLIKIFEYMQRQNNTLDDIQELDRSILASAMQTGPDRINLSGGMPNLAYNYGFWGLEVGHSLGCKQEKWLPFMSGYGGISVVMVSPDILYYNFSDNYKHIWLDVIKELHQQFEFCEVN